MYSGRLLVLSEGFGAIGFGGRSANGALASLPHFIALHRVSAPKDSVAQSLACMLSSGSPSYTEGFRLAHGSNISPCQILAKTVSSPDHHLVLVGDIKSVAVVKSGFGAWGTAGGLYHKYTIY